MNFIFINMYKTKNKLNIKTCQKIYLRWNLSCSNLLQNLRICSTLSNYKIELIKNLNNLD